jgi:hypothetical protein
MSDSSTKEPLSNTTDVLTHDRQVRVSKRLEKDPPQCSKTFGGVETYPLESTERAAPRTRTTEVEAPSDRVSKLTEELQAQKKSNEDLELINVALERDRNHHRERSQAFESRLQEFQAYYASAEEAIQQNDRRISGLNSQNSEFKRLLLEEKASNKSMRGKLEDQQTRIKELECRIKSQETSVTKAQEAAVKVLSITVSSSIPDDSIRRQFSTLFQVLHDWARQNSVQDPSSLRHSQFLAALVERKVLVDCKTWKPEHSFDIDSRTAPATLLNASLAKELCFSFLRNPFSFLQDDEKRSSSGPESGSEFTASTISTLKLVENSLKKCKL